MVIIIMFQQSVGGQELARALGSPMGVGCLLYLPSCIRRPLTMRWRVSSGTETSRPRSSRSRDWIQDFWSNKRLSMQWSRKPEGHQGGRGEGEEINDVICANQ